MDMRVYLIYFLCLNLFEGGLSTSMIGENVFLRSCACKESVLTYVEKSLCSSVFTVYVEIFYSDRKVFTNTESDLLPISNFVLRYLHRSFKQIKEQTAIYGQETFHF